MKFDKLQKAFLKDKGLWETVKKYAKKDSDYMGNPKEYGNLDRAFYWELTDEGFRFWEGIAAEFEGSIKCT